MNLAENFIIDETTFCSFFNVDCEKFKNFDKNNNGLINSFMIIMILFLFKNEGLKSKLDSNRLIYYFRYFQLF